MKYRTVEIEAKGEFIFWANNHRDTEKLVSLYYKFNSSWYNFNLTYTYDS
jgi:hypothetical protein